jgi:Tfp pilus assembly protein PilV
MTLSDPRPATRDQQDALSVEPSPITYYLLPITSLRASARGGFTLIETALALLAIGLGLLALFGLGRIGLQTSKETENDARCAQMADAVFETLREYNVRFVDAARTNAIGPTAWVQQWQAAVSTPAQIPFPPVANMSRSENLYLAFRIEDTAETTFAAFDPEELSLTDWNPRYNLYFGMHYESSHVGGGPVFLSVMLVIYPDGDTSSSEPRVFHTTLTNPGGLP